MSRQHRTERSDSRDIEREHPSSDEAFKDDREIAVWNARLAARLRDQRRRLQEARALEPGTISYGAANYPHDPDVWLADWRDSLPQGDPRRHYGPPIVRNGSSGAYHTMRAANEAIRKAYGLRPEPPRDRSGGADSADQVPPELG